MFKNIGLFLVGLIVGIILMGGVVWIAMPNMMLTVHKSTLDFEETVSAINESALEHEWLVPKIYNIQKSLQAAGHDDMTRVKILSLCQPHYAYNILRDDDNKMVTAIMPCRIGVYEAGDGQVYVSEMNIGLMSKMFGGTIERVMGQVAKEESEILEGIIEK